MQEYDWDQVTKVGGVVDAVNYLHFKETGRPRSWSGGVGGAGVRIVSNKEMDKETKGGLCPTRLYTRVNWRVTYRENAKWFLDKVIPLLKELGSPENVRIVFWFDN